MFAAIRRASSTLILIKVPICQPCFKWRTAYYLKEEVEGGGLKNEHQYQIMPSNAYVVLGHAGSGSERPTGRLLQVPAVGTATGEPCTRAEDPAGRLL